MMRIKFDAPTHRYQINGKDVPSVTQVLGMANLYAFIDKQLLAKAARFGTAVHKATELYDAGTLDYNSLDAALVPYLEGWRKFLTDTQFQIINSEEIVGSSLGYAGTYDRIGLLNGKLTLLDIKTSETIPKTTPLQLSAYSSAYEEMHHSLIEQRVCVKLKPVNYELSFYHDQSNDFWMFKKFLDCYKWSQS